MKAWIAALCVGAMVGGYFAVHAKRQTEIEFPSELLSYNWYPWRKAATSENLRRTVAYSGGGVNVVLRQHERDPAEPEVWHKYELSESVSYTTTDVASRLGGDELFVAGLASNGVAVIERWRYPVREGGFRIVRSSGPVQPLGTPSPTFECAEVLDGPEFEPLKPGSRRSARRQVIYRGTNIGAARLIEADPEGRFLLILSYPHSDLYRLRLEEGALPELLYDSSEIPSLREATHVVLWKHDVRGRIYLFTDKSSHARDREYTYLLDSDNDGVFETIEAVGIGEWKAFREEHEPFEFFWNTGVTFDW